MGKTNTVISRLRHSAF
nr:unnamed protein product [Callosobruchus analis]